MVEDEIVICHNPNLTTTQLNLTLQKTDTKITLHHHHHPSQTQPPPNKLNIRNISAVTHPIQQQQGHQEQQKQQKQ